MVHEVLNKNHCDPSWNQAPFLTTHPPVVEVMNNVVLVLAE